MSTRPCVSLSAAVSKLCLVLATQGLDTLHTVSRPGRGQLLWTSQWVAVTSAFRIFVYGIPKEHSVCHSLPPQSHLSHPGFPMKWANFGMARMLRTAKLGMHINT